MGNGNSNSGSPGEMVLVLSVLLGADAGRTFHINKLLMTIGRGEDRDIVLTDRAISRMHCEIEFQNGILLIRDSGSQNGIRVNGRPTQEQELHEGDQIDIGSTRLVVINSSQGGNV